MSIAGCTQDQQGQAQNEVSKGAQNAYDQTRQAAERGIQSMQKTSAQMSETSKIKGAIDGSNDIDSSSIGVDTIDKTVYIIGTVSTQEMKDKADKIANAIVDKGYAIKNFIEVAPKT